jgi:hypothetical protein
LKITETDALTGVTIEREPTTEELKQMAIDETAAAERQNEANLKAEAKAALLERLGITADEASLLLA